MTLFVAATLAVDLAAAEHWPQPGAGHIAMACLMLSQSALLAVWTVVGSFKWLPRLVLLALGIGLWSWQWHRQRGVPAIDVVCLLSLSSAMVAVPLAIFRHWSAQQRGRPQISLAALIGLVTGVGLLLGLARQFSKPDDLYYLRETFGIAAAASLTTLAAVVAMLGPRLTAGHLAVMGLITGVAGLILSATIVGHPLTAWAFVLVHALFVVASLSVWRICGVRLRWDCSPLGCG